MKQHFLNVLLKVFVRIYARPSKMISVGVLVPNTTTAPVILCCLYADAGPQEI